MAMTREQVDSPRRLADVFANLGAPEHAGDGFAFTQACLDKDCGGEIANLPRPDYEHAIFLNDLSGYFIVTRPQNDGKYWLANNLTFKRVR